jgi:hypothetical protein
MIPLRQFVALACLLAFFSTTIFAQKTAVAQLEKGISVYSRVKDIADSYKSDEPIAIIPDSLEALVQRGIANLNAVLATPSADSLYPIAKYLQTTMLFNYAGIFLVKGDKTKAIAALQALEKPMQEISALSYPLAFEGDTRAMTVQWSDFAPELLHYQIEMGNYYRQENQQDTALAYMRKARDLGDWDTDLLAANASGILDIKEARSELDDEMLEAALVLMTQYGDMDQAARKAANLPDDTPARCAKAVEQILDATPELSGGGEVWARTYRLLVNAQLNQRALQFAEKALGTEYVDREFLLSVFPLAKTEKRPELAKKVLNQYADLVGAGECDNLTVLADKYKDINEDLKAQQYRDKASKCVKAREREIKVAGRDGGFYIGTYLLPLIRTDWGAVAAIQTRRHIFEFSYQQLTDRRDRLYDLRFRGVDGAADQKVRWDGYYAHFAANKLSGKKGARRYKGILLGYNQRDYQPMTVANISDENGMAVNDAPVTFRPTERRYIFMLNWGAHSYGRYLASDFYLGYGLSWNEFSRGNDNYDSKDYDYRDNALLNGRRGGRISLLLRIGVTIGLQIGPRTFEPKKSKKKKQVG